MLKKNEPAINSSKFPIVPIEEVKKLGDLQKEGYDINYSQGAVVVNIDKRRFYVNGGVKAENVNFGDNSSINQTIQGTSEEELNKLFDQLHEFLRANGEPKDQEIADKLKENIKKKKWETAKDIFTLLSQSAQISSAGVGIAKAIGLI
ncbi:hypothetical protein ABNB59_19320 [Paenibacillus larvae]|uniref:Uncharacterized protein n=4 Tax=root TaxID=1 RepID=A0A0K2CYV0_9CAUD|nr:hypothetical protein [Paenibacillus larvae]YP_009193840.1 hypothetical protein HARRISON_27 [Paenibacillus phage Harrison]ALA12592.1 hypothetical protein PAISLEY_27 [Paenibacillus phage Paisley]UYL93371.1 hypothetical protein LILO_25 [Paenibacillus phage Lilo]ALA12431.1 hypothetical protein HARRISON_27 [Paenibacillus phage Harrison]AQR76570.1 hypothetical protein BXP28_03405 [Paenibacillus larvae subsp. larvae]AVF22577.1 hypothetical protein ERICI_02765 [Paenibacillus larvae subsp. larvae]